MVVIGIAALPATVEPGTSVKDTELAVVETVSDSARVPFRATVGALELSVQANAGTEMSEALTTAAATMNALLIREMFCMWSFSSIDRFFKVES